MSGYYTIKPTKTEYIITLTKSSKRYIFFGKEIIKETYYRGDCTVWHHYPSGFRCEGYLEKELNMVWKRNMWTRADMESKK